MTIKEFEERLLLLKCVCEDVHPDVDVNSNILIRVGDRYYEPDLRIDEWKGGDEVTRDISIHLGSEV